jgi:hypothetical protein
MKGQRQRGAIGARSPARRDSAGCDTNSAGAAPHRLPPLLPVRDGEKDTFIKGFANRQRCRTSTFDAAALLLPVLHGGEVPARDARGSTSVAGAGRSTKAAFVLAFGKRSTRWSALPAAWPDRRDAVAGRRPQRQVRTPAKGSRWPSTRPAQPAGVKAMRRGGRVVEGARLERVYTGNRIKGSNPFLSASRLYKVLT